MIQSEKMLSVGGLAAGMAHEINNPLAGMLQTANVMSSRLNISRKNTANKEAAEKAGTTLQVIESYMELRGIPSMIEKINESGRRIAAIVNNMLSFARKSEDVFSTYDIPFLLDKTLKLAETDYDFKKQYDFKQINILKEYAENIPHLPCDISKIQQVFLNILRNGAQAMQSAKISDPQLIIRVFIKDNEKKLTIEIEDNGPGISNEIKSKIFEPFFTTKPIGVGTGLGLSVSYFIITETHNGDLYVESNNDRGSKFIIKLPI
jgi:signal transduction histidine kinase